MDLVFFSPTEFHGILSFFGRLSLCCLFSRPEVWLDSTLRQVGFPLIHQFSIIPVCYHPLPVCSLSLHTTHHIIFMLACVYWWASVMVFAFAQLLPSSAQTLAYYYSACISRTLLLVSLFLIFLAQLYNTDIFVLLCFVFLCVPILGWDGTAVVWEWRPHSRRGRAAATTIQLNFKQPIQNWSCFRIQLSKWIRSATDNGNCNWPCVRPVWNMDLGKNWNCIKVCRGRLRNEAVCTHMGREGFSYETKSPMAGFLIFRMVWVVGITSWVGGGYLGFTKTVFSVVLFNLI